MLGDTRFSSFSNRVLWLMTYFFCAVTLFQNGYSFLYIRNFERFDHDIAEIPYLACLRFLRLIPQQVIDDFGQKPIHVRDRPEPDRAFFLRRGDSLALLLFVFHSVSSSVEQHS